MVLRRQRSAMDSILASGAGDVGSIPIVVAFFFLWQISEFARLFLLDFWWMNFLVWKGYYDATDFKSWHNKALDEGECASKIAFGLLCKGNRMDDYWVISLLTIFFDILLVFLTKKKVVFVFNAYLFIHLKKINYH